MVGVSEMVGEPPTRDCGVYMNVFVLLVMLGIIIRGFFVKPLFMREIEENLRINERQQITFQKIVASVMLFLLFLIVLTKGITV